jgi:ubiquinone/menaquinone biosynthesis C-methylase UbiE
MLKTDYGKIANTYNKRYKSNSLSNIEIELIRIISENNYKNILEAGCGTGRWINSLDQKKLTVFGLDFSFDMLKISKHDKTKLSILNADADFIPFKDDFFDLIFCVNAIHHFPDKKKFIEESKRILANNGMLAVFGVDPYIDKDWYVYKYFDGVYDNDLKRFPSKERFKNLVSQNGFERVKIKTVEKVSGKRVGQDIFNDPFLDKHGNSQLANLTEDEYQKGIEKIKTQIEKNPQTVFTTSVIFYLVTAKKI